MTNLELEDLVRRFNNVAVTRAEWTHAAHLAVGLWHVSRFGRDEALVRLRTAITRLNEANGVVNSATGGYHETITRAYVQVLADFAARHAGRTPAECVTALLASPLADREALLWFYTRERLDSVEARLGWVEPDVMPLP
jgi:hypothetical protein